MGKDPVDTTTREMCPVTYPVCFYQQFPSSTFWKWTLGIMAAAMLIFSACLMAMAITLNAYAYALREAKLEILNAEAKTLTQIQHHKEISLENRAVQQEMRGLLSAYLKFLQDEKQKK